MQHHLSALTFAVLSVMSTSQSYANDNEQSMLPTINIKADEQSNNDSSNTYLIKKSSSASKLNIDLKETPQTVNVVTRQQMDDFGLNSTRDILNNTPGVTVTGLETNRTTYTARGFDISNVLVDGIGIPQVDSYNYNNSDNDSYFYDRVEVIKGADALTNALGDPGATINYIRKRPSKEFEANVGISYGSWNTQRYEADISGSLTEDGRVRGRLVGFEKTGDSYLDRYSEEKNGFQGILEADLTHSTNLSIGYSKTRQYANASQWGALPLVNSNGQPLSYARNYNYAPDWTYYDWNIDNYFANFEQKLAGDWKLKLGYNQKKSTVQDQMLYLSGFPSAIDNTSGISLYPDIYNQKITETTANAEIQGTYNLFDQQHEANIGYNWSRYKANNVSAYGSSLNVPTTDLDSWTPSEQTWGELTAASPEERTMKSWYAATRLHVTDDLKLILGANYTSINTLDYSKNKVSPYAGISYNFSTEYTGYMSYTSIFRPQTVIDLATKQTAVPVDGESYEIGIKSDWMDGNLTGNIAVFRTNENNFALNPIWDTNYNQYSSNLGTLRSQGVEVGLNGKINENLNLVLGFSSFSLKNMDTGARGRPNIPTQTFNILATYNIPQIPNLKIGAGVKWQDSITDTSYTSVKQDSYALFNAMASYELNNHISFQVNGNNLTNKKYLTGLSGGQGYYGAPANYTVAVKFKY